MICTCCLQLFLGFLDDGTIFAEQTRICTKFTHQLHLRCNYTLKLFIINFLLLIFIFFFLIILLSKDSIWILFSFLNMYIFRAQIGCDSRNGSSRSYCRYATSSSLCMEEDAGLVKMVHLLLLTIVFENLHQLWPKLVRQEVLIYHSRTIRSFFD